MKSTSMRNRRRSIRLLCLPAVAAIALVVSAVSGRVSPSAFASTSVRPVAAITVRPAGLPVGAPFLGHVQISNNWGVPKIGKCLDAAMEGGGVNGNKVQIWDCNTSPVQEWDIYQNVATGAYYLVNSRFNKCLDADLNSIGRDGTKVQLWACTGQENQQWYPAVAWAIFWQHIYSQSPLAGTSNALDADTGGGLVNGAKVQLWHSWGGDNQVWSMHVWGQPA